MGKYLLIITMFVCTTNSVLSAKLPSKIETCKINDKNLDGCLLKTITNALPILKDGVPELNVVPLDPLEVPSMTIGEGTGAVHVIQNYKDIQISGVTQSNVTKVDASKLKEFRLYTESFTPSLQLKANYNLNGRILLIPITGDGECTITLENMKCTHTLIGEKLEKKGKLYMKVKQYIITLHPEKVQFDFKNLFNGEERLGKEMNNLLNENWKEVFDDVKKGYEQSLGLIFGDFANRLFSKIPFNEVFRT